MAQHNEPTPDVAGCEEPILQQEEKVADEDEQQEQQGQEPWLIQVATRQDERLAIHARAVFDRLEGWQQLDDFVQVYRNPGCTYREAVRLLAELHLDNVSAMLFLQFPLDPPNGDDPAPFYAGCRRHLRPRFVREDVLELLQRGISVYHLMIPRGHADAASGALGDGWKALDEHMMTFTREATEEEGSIRGDVDSVLADAHQVQEAIRAVLPQAQVLLGVSVDYRADRKAMALELTREKLQMLQQQVQRMAAGQP